MKKMKVKEHPLFWIWKGMKDRCYKKYSSSYKYYGAIGITVHEDWFNFWKFVSDVGDRPSLKHSLDRIDNSKGYEPKNVRWATAAQQAQNTRKKLGCIRGHKWSIENTIYTHNGKIPTRRCRSCERSRVRLGR